MLQMHHVLARLLARHPVISALDGRINSETVRNLMTLPSRQPLSSAFNSSPHTGGHLGTYYKGFRDYLTEVEKSPRFGAGLAGDTRALDETAADLNQLLSAAKYALANGHLLANTPMGMTREAANEANRNWFTNWRQYAADNAAQIHRMQETIDQLSNSGQWEAAQHWPILSPTESLGLAERIEMLGRSAKGSPISLHFTAADPVPDLPGLVLPSVDARLPGFIPPFFEGADRQDFTASNPLLTYGLEGFPILPPDWQRLMQVPPSVAMPAEPQVLQFHPETSQPFTFSDGSPVMGPQAAPDEGEALLMGAALLGVGAMMVPGWQSLGTALLTGLTAAALTRPAFSSTASSVAKAADGVFRNGATPYDPFGASLSSLHGHNEAGDSHRPSGVLQTERRLVGSEPDRDSSFADRFGGWTGAPRDIVSAQDAAVGPPASGAGAVAPEEVRRLTRANASNAGSMFTSGTAPVRYLPSTEFNDRFGSWTRPTADGRPLQTSRLIGTFADDPSYLIPPPIFGLDDPNNTRNDAEEWFSRRIRPLLPPDRRQ
jgi:hypothetical protein